MKKEILFAATAAVLVFSACNKANYINGDGTETDGSNASYSKDLIIEEVYFTGSPIDGSESPSDDQYIKLTNNSRSTVYADRVMFVRNFITGTITSTGAYYTYPQLPDGIVVSDMYMIPGSGNEHPVEPGKSIVLALAAQNFKQGFVIPAAQAQDPEEQEEDTVVEGNANAIDLSKADFEFYDQNDYYPDSDNPDVENLDIWFKTSSTLTYLHNRGLESYAIVRVPAGETAESIMTNRHWSGTYHFIFGEYDFDYDIADEDAFVIPSQWVLDAVNCSLEDAWYQNPWGAKMDAGWTHAGDFDGDQSRFGKSVRRIIENGVLKDTDNSTADFTHGAVPSLK